MGLEQYERRVYSQNGEDGVLEWLESRIPTKVMVELGSGDGTQCNSRNLVANHGWVSRLVDFSFGDWITAENVNRFITCPIGILSIDIDGNDYWIWKAVTARPDLVVIEYNPWLRLEPITMAYNPDHKWDSTDNYGASLAALHKLGDAKGYQCIGANGVNAFFVRRDVNRNLPDLCVHEAYRPPISKPKGTIKPDRFVSV